MISVPRVATHIVLSSCLHKVQIVVVTSIDMLRVNKSRLNMMFARKTNPLSKDCQFYCLDIIQTVLPCCTCYFSHRWCGNINHSRL